MNFQWLKKIALATVLLASFSAQAGPIVDVKEINEYVYAGIFSSNHASWTHDLGSSFVPGSAESATISIQFWDDQEKDLPELASIIIGTIDFLDGAILYNPVSDWNGSLGVGSLASLNAFGTLSVKVWSVFGDFYVGNSTLTVFTSDTASVPESSSLALLALGLLGLVVLRRKGAV